MPVSHFAGG